MSSATATRSFTSSARVGSPTAAYIADPDQPYRPFYYLKITGLPYYFFSIIDPTDPKWGDAQWTLPAGYTGGPDGRGAVPGMMVPATDFSQQLNDIIGGIASAERIKLSMMDFKVVDAHGAHSFFGRLLAPGRTTASSTATIGHLYQDLPATAPTGDIAVHASGGAFTTGDIFIGGETIGIGAVAGPTAQVYTLTMNARNKYPCTPTYPATPYYRVNKDSSGNIDPSSVVLVTQNDPITFVGRSAALYIGHLTPDGRPEPEADSLVRFVGHIRGITYGNQPDQPGTFEFDIESVVADLSKSIIAPALAHADLAHGIYLPTAIWREMILTLSVAETSSGLTGGTTQAITLPAADYSSGWQAILAALQLAFQTLGPITVGVGIHSATFTMSATSGGSDPHGGSPGYFVITATSVCTGAGIVATVTLGYPIIGTAAGAPPAQNSSIGLLTAMGWMPGGTPTISATTPIDVVFGSTIFFTADRQVPSVFIPLEHNGGRGVTIALDSSPDVTGDRFFSDQGDGSAVGWVRLGNAQVVQVLGHGPSFPNNLLIGPASQNTAWYPAYYVEAPASGTFDQVLHIPAPTTFIDLLAVFQLVASTGSSPDGEFNVFPQGCGLALNGLLDKNSIRQAAAAGVRPAYLFDVDKTTTFAELWTGTSKLLGLFLVWDPSTAAIAVRQISLANPKLASAFVFSESNRLTVDDRSKVISDESNLRTGWTVRHGWDYQQRKFTGAEYGISDSWALAAYQNASRTEIIEDRFMDKNPDVGAIDAYLKSLTGQRSVFTRYPWAKVTRSVNKTGLLLSPGLYCLVGDKTIFNSFTGLQGILTTDGIYGFITAVRSNLKTGAVEVTFLIDLTFDSASLRPWSPTGLLNFSGTGNGYDNATGICSMDSWYTQIDHDGGDFIVGDKVALVPRTNPPGAPAYEKKGTVTAVATDGTTVTIDAGLGAISSTRETIMILQDYGSQTTARQTTPATRVTFQGDGVALLIVGAARLEKWT